MATLRIKGVKEIQHAFDALGKKAGGKLVRQSIRAGLQAIKKESVALAPKDTGLLARSIKVRAAASRKRGVISLVVATGKGDYKGETFYGAFQEYGTKEMVGKRYMTRAFDLKKHDVTSQVMQQIADGIEREAKS